MHRFCERYCDVHGQDVALAELFVVPVDVGDRQSAFRKCTNLVRGVPIRSDQREDIWR